MLCLLLSLYPDIIPCFAYRRGSLRSRPPPVATSDTYWPGRGKSLVCFLS